jgi:hypothetical protein
MRGIGIALVCAVVAGVTAAADRQQAFRARTDAVGVPVTVWQDGVMVGALGQDDFELFDNGVAQTITTMSSGDLPVDVTVVLDTSGSVEGDMLDRLLAEARATDVLGDEDRLRLLTFKTTVHEALPLGSVQGAPLASGLGAGGATAFHHGVILALVGETSAGRPHLVVALSDGRDNVSLFGAPAVLDVARHTAAALHVVLPGVRRLFPLSSDATFSQVRSVTRGWVPFADPGDVRKLREAAEVTGGSLRTPPADQPAGESLGQVLNEFRSGYVLWYTPTGVDGRGWHTITVNVRGRRFDVRARQGYSAR